VKGFKAIINTDLTLNDFTGSWVVKKGREWKLNGDAERKTIWGRKKNHQKAWGSLLGS
jgi:hypothetical protein